MTNSASDAGDALAAPAETISAGAASNGKPSAADLAGARAMGARPLLPHHRQMLEVARAISPAMIEAIGHRSAEYGMDLTAIGLDVFPTPGIIIPIHPPAGLAPGEPPIYAYRPDVPKNPKRKYYWQAGVRMRLDCPPPCHAALRDPTITLYITEGWLKMAALASAGLTAVGLIGVACFGFKPEPGMPILRDWAAIDLTGLMGRLIRLCFDSDTWRNPNVLRDLQRLTAFLSERGARVEWVIPPDAEDGSKQGIDDWFATGGTVGGIESLVTQPTTSPLIGAERDDSGNSDRFIFENADRAAWCPGRKVWATWTGQYWDFSNPERVIALAKETARSFQMAAAQLPNTYPNRDDIVTHAGKLGSRYHINAMVELARPDLSVAASAFDTNPWLLNCLNGTIDLRTGRLLPHDPRDLIDKLCPVEFDQDTRSDDWDRFLDLFTSGDAAVATYLQRVAGYCLTGIAREGSIFFLLGETRTGKTTFVNALKATLGDYGWKAAFDTFLSGRRPGAVRDDIAAIEGKRLVVASEVSSGKRLDEAVVKEITGEDDVNARGLYERGRNFRPVSKLILAANDFPHVRSDDSGTWARLNLIKCQNTELQRREYLELKQRVMDVNLTGPAILAWAVRGCLDWQEADDLARPQSVDEAVAAQREEFQPLRDFLAEACEIGPEHRATRAQLLAEYAFWGKRMGEQSPIGRNRFWREMRAAGFEEYQSSAGERGFKGLRLRPMLGGRVEQT